jgi:hypothetical protein
MYRNLALGFRVRKGFCFGGGRVIRLTCRGAGISREKMHSEGASMAKTASNAARRKESISSEFLPGRSRLSKPTREEANKHAFVLPE